MPHDSLRDFLDAIDEIGELVRIAQPVRARLEIAEIADRAMKSAGGGPALLFERVMLENGQSSRYPVAINLFGSMRRMCLALGVDRLDDIGDRIAELLKLKVPEGLLGKLSMLPKLAEIAKFPPRTKGGTPACQEVVQRGDEIDLDDIPFLVTWPEDGGRYITLPMVITDDPSRGIRNVGMYRVQVLGIAPRWRCTGSGTRSGPPTGVKWQPAARRCRSSSPSAATPRASTPPPRRSRRPSTSSSSPASCARRRSNWPRRSPATSRCRPRRSS